MTVLAALATAVMHAPAAALADSSPSAGDNQYTDPLASPPSTTPALKVVSATSASAPATSPATSQSTSTLALTPAPPSASSQTQSTSAPAASTTTAGTSTSSSPTLPFSGYDVGFAAALGAAIAAAGTVIRRRSGMR